MATKTGKRAKAIRKPGAVAQPAPHPPLYFYGVSKPFPTADRLAVAGVDGAHRVRSLACSGLLCWVSSVDRDFVDRLGASMEDLEWLADAGVRHQHAVAAISAEATIVPARFGTIFLSHDSLIKDIQRRKSLLLKSLARFEGTDEWGVKVFVVPQSIAATADVSGRDYLQRKAAALQSRSHAAPDAETAEFEDSLKKIAKDSASVKASMSSGQRNLQWQASFLVPRSRRKQWDNLLKGFARRWAGKRQVECSGPWPPYSFVK